MLAMERIKGTLTRKTDSAFSELESAFRGICDIRDLNRRLEALQRAGKRSNRDSELKALFRLFDLCGIAYERGRDNAYYAQLVHSAKLPNLFEIEDRMLLALYDCHREYPSPEDYMRRTVDLLCDKADPWQAETLRVRILRQFIKYGDCLLYKRENVDGNGAASVRTVRIYNGEMYIRKYLAAKGRRVRRAAEAVDAVEDDVFDVLATATPAQKKPLGPYGLIKLVNDLAGGKFRTGGATRKGLYLFAMVFNMTYCNRARGEKPDPDRDIEIRLFQDYYNNSLMRFISEDFRENQNDFEQNPSGQGINYKNFAEMVYLYYISRDLPAREKLRRSAEMIQRLQARSAENGERRAREDRDTEHYMRVFREDLLSLAEPAFEERVYRDYDCDTQALGYSVGEMELKTEQNTAFGLYKSILRSLDAQGTPREERAYGLWFDLEPGQVDEKFDALRKLRPDLDRDKFAAFAKLLSGVDRFLKKPAATADTMNRTSLIAACYYRFNARHLNNMGSQWCSFQEVYDNFKLEVDEVLEAAHYQPLSDRNFFDVAVAFSSYAYLKE